MTLGKTVPDFILPDQHGNDFRLYENLDSWLILVFFLRENDELCTKQLCHYRDNFASFLEAGIKLVAIGNEPVEKHREFTQKHNLNFPFLSDYEMNVTNLFNVLNGNGVSNKKVFILNKNAKVIYTDYKLPFYYVNQEKIFGRKLVDTKGKDF